MQWSGVQCYVMKRSEATFEPLKVVRTLMYILTWKCILYYNGVYFFDIIIFKNGPDMRYFVYFDLEIYFTLQRRVLF